MLIFLCLFFSCSSTVEDTKEDPITEPATHKWSKLSTNAPIETKELGFFLGTWTLEVTQTHRNGLFSNGSGRVSCYIDDDSLSIARQFNVTFENKFPAWNGVGSRKYNAALKRWSMSYTPNNGVKSEGIGNFENGIYFERVTTFSSAYNTEATLETRIVDVTANSYREIGRIIYEDGVIVENSHTILFTKVN